MKITNKDIINYTSTAEINGIELNCIEFFTEIVNIRQKICSFLISLDREQYLRKQTVIERINLSPIN